MKYVMYPHGGSGNHGCEAIVRSTAKLIGNECILFTNQLEEDIRAGLKDICTLKSAEVSIKRGSLSYLKALFLYKFCGKKEAFDKLVYSHIVKDAKSSEYFLSIGGDNYCYGDPEFIYLVNRMVDRAGIKRILWGASVEPSSINERMLNDLRGYHRIWARESLTCEALRENGLSQTFLLPDPAFVLDRIDQPLPEGFEDGNTVGINVSPMIISYEKNQGVVFRNYVNLVSHILDETTMNIVFIPHVVWSHNDDRKPLRDLYEMFRETGRVLMVEDHNAEVLKGYIARCRFMIVARTHASIAAYSSQVPTLVVGYSVKARGIARDIFGTETNYVLPVQSLSSENELVESFKWLYTHEEGIKEHYAKVIPQYIDEVYQIKEKMGEG